MAECGGSDCLEPQRRVGHWSLYRLFYFLFFFEWESAGRRRAAGLSRCAAGRRSQEKDRGWLQVDGSAPPASAMGIQNGIDGGR